MKHFLSILSFLGFSSLVLGQTGNVGIGQSSPKAKLDINGNVIIGTNFSSASSTVAPPNGALIEGQLGVGTTSPDLSAILDLVSTNKGVLIPRIQLLGLTDNTTITNPATGLLIWHSDIPTVVGMQGAGFYYNGGTGASPNWVKLSTYSNPTLGDITSPNSAVSITGGTNAVQGAGVSIDIAPNSVSSAGLVSSGAGQNTKVWGTDAAGNPAWRDASGQLVIRDVVSGNPNIVITNGTGQIVGASNMTIGLNAGDVLSATNSAISVASGTGKALGGDVTLDVANNALGQKGIVSAPTALNANQVWGTDAAGNPSWTTTNGAIVKKNVLSNNTNLTVANGTQQIVGANDLTLDLTTNNVTTSGSPALAVSGNTTGSVVGSTPLNISLTSGDVLPAVNSAISVASGTGKALGGDVTLDVANNALGQKGIVSAPTAANANQVWGTDAAGNPSWTTTNGAIVKKNVLSNNTNLTVANGTQQIVGANDLTLDLTTNNVTTSGSSALAVTSGGTGSVVGSTPLNISLTSGDVLPAVNSAISVASGTGKALGGDVTLDVANNALGQKGIVSAPTALNANQVWGTDAAGNPSWTTTNGAIVKKNVLSNNTNLTVANGTQQIVGANDLTLDLTTNNVTTSGSSALAVTSGGTGSVVGSTPLNISLTSGDVLPAVNSAISVASGTGKALGGNVTLDVANNALGQKGIVSAPTALNANQVWGTDAAGNPSWTTTNGAIVKKNVLSNNTNLTVANGTQQIVGANDLTLDLTTNNVTTSGSSALAVTSGGTGSVVGSTPLNISLTSGDVLPAVNSAISVASGTGKALGGDVTLDVANNALGQKGIVSAPTALNANQVWGTDAAGNPSWTTTNGAIVKKNVLSNNTNLTVANGTQQIVGANDLTLDLTTNNVTTSGSSALAVSGNTTGSVVGSTPLNISLTSGDVLPAVNSAISVASGTGKALGGDVTLDVANNALGQKGIVSAPTAANANQVWGTDAAGNPSWTTTNGAIVKKNVLSNNTNLTVANGTQQIVGVNDLTLDLTTNNVTTSGSSALAVTSGGTGSVVGSTPLNISLTSGDVLPATNSAISVASGTGKALGGDVTLDVANNALGQKGIVSAPTALNANQVWGTDAAGNPSWTTTNGAIVKKNVLSNNTNLTVANGTQQIVGANDLTLDLTTNNVTTSGSSALAVTSGGTGSVVGSTPLNISLTSGDVLPAVNSAISVASGTGKALGGNVTLDVANNALGQKGIVSAPTALNANQVWGTDAAGNPSWTTTNGVIQKKDVLSNNTNLTVANGTQQIVGANDLTLDLTTNNVTTSGSSALAVSGNTTGSVVGSTPLNISLTAGDVLSATNSAISVASGTGRALGGDVTLDVANNALGQKGIVAAPTVANANQVWGTDAAGNPSWTTTNGAIVKKNVLSNNTNLTVANGTQQIVGANDLTLDLTTNNVTTSGSSALAVTSGGTGSVVGSTPLNISLTSGDVLPAVNSAISVASGAGKALGGNVTLDVANNALGQKGIVAAPTALNANQVWGTDASGNPSWTTTNGVIQKKDVLSTNTNLTVVNGTQQIVGATDLTIGLNTNDVTTSGSSALAVSGNTTGSVVGSTPLNISLTAGDVLPATNSAISVASGAGKALGGNVTLDVANNALGQKGIVAAPTAANANQVWGTDASGNPSWTTTNGVIVKKDVISNNAALIVSNGTNQVVGASDLGLDLTTGDVTTTTSGVTITGGTGKTVGGNVAVDIAINSATTPGLVTATTGLPNKIWASNLAGVPDWRDANGLLVKNDVTSSTTGMTISNGTGQVVGGSNMTVDYNLVTGVAALASGAQGVLGGTGNTNTYVGADGQLHVLPAASTGDITDVTAGAGLTGGASSGNATLDIGAGAGIVVNTDDIAVKYDNSSIVLNGSGQLSVPNYLPSTRTLTINGTANQVSVTPSGAQDLSADRTWTVSTPQDIHTAATPTFSDLTLSSNNVNGGVVYTTATGNLNTTAAGTSGQVLQSNGAAAPTWVTPTTGTVTSVTGTSPINVATGTTTPVISLGTVPVVNGGTGLTTLTSNGVLYGNGTGNVNLTAAPAAGQVLLGNASGVPTFTTVSGDATISSAGVVTLNQNNNGYIKNQFAAAQSTANFWISSNGRMDGGLTVGAGATIDNNNGNTGTVNTNALAFGNGSGEGIASKRNAGGNQYGLDFYTSFTNRMAITGAGSVGIGTSAPAARLNVVGGATWLSRDGLGECCGIGATLALAEATTTTGKVAGISFHNGGQSEGNMSLQQNVINGISSRRLQMYDNQGQGMGLELTGRLWYGNGSVRTETRDDAGLQGNSGAQSGFFETSAPAPAANWYPGASNWQHLIDTRHSNNGNNYAMQLAGSFFDQNLWLRKTNGAANTAWTQVHTNASMKTNQYTLGSTVATTTSTTVWKIYPGLSQTLTLAAGDRVFFDLAGTVYSTSSNGYHQISIGISAAPVGGPTAGSFLSGLTAGGAAGTGIGGTVIANHDYTAFGYNPYSPFSSTASYDVGTAGTYTFVVYIRTTGGSTATFGGPSNNVTYTGLQYTILRQ